MTRTFTPLHAGRVIQLQTHGTSLDLESTVLTGRTPVAWALAGWLHWPGADRLTLMSDGPAPGAPDGFLQARRRGRGPEADVTFVAPGLRIGHGAARTWQRLLGDACVALGQAGVGRIFSASDTEDALAGQVLQQAGFVPFDAETVYRRSAPEAAATPPGARLGVAGAPTGAPTGAQWNVRAFAADERAALAALLAAAQPEASGSHESAWSRWACVPAPSPRRRERWRGVTDSRGRLVGALRLVPGRDAVWLNVAGGPTIDPGALYALAIEEADRLLPGVAVWTAVRDSDPALGSAARAAGFAPIVRRRRSVRLTGLQRLAPSWREATAAVPQASSSPVAQARPRVSKARGRADSLPREGT